MVLFEVSIPVKSTRLHHLRLTNNLYNMSSRCETLHPWCESTPTEISTFLRKFNKIGITHRLPLRPSRKESLEYDRSLLRFFVIQQTKDRIGEGLCGTTLRPLVSGLTLPSTVWSPSSTDHGAYLISSVLWSRGHGRISRFLEKSSGMCGQDINGGISSFLFFCLTSSSPFRLNTLVVNTVTVIRRHWTDYA